MDVSEPGLRRYTDLPPLIHLLKHKELTLLDPSSWDDKNDSYFLRLYREKCQLTSVLALCFTRSQETYHHWRVFSPGSGGVCVQFDAAALRKAIKKVKGVKLEPVEYLTLPAIRTTKIAKSRLPFLKRYAFRPEEEVRMLWDSKSEQKSFLNIPIELSAIKRITLSPWLHESLAEEVKPLLNSIQDCERIKIFRSTLISNAEWMDHGNSAK